MVCVPPYVPRAWFPSSKELSASAFLFPIEERQRFLTPLIFPDTFDFPAVDVLRLLIGAAD
jgi:hypothetical protein